MAPSSRQTPTIPLQVIMTAAKTVSRANEAYSGLPELIKVTIRPTSMTVTATASSKEPNGSPTRWATTSAWWTALTTAAANTRATSTTTTVPRLRPQVRTNATAATGGAMVVQLIRRLVFCSATWIHHANSLSEARFTSR